MINAGVRITHEVYPLDILIGSAGVGVVIDGKGLPPVQIDK